MRLHILQTMSGSCNDCYYVAVFVFKPAPLGLLVSGVLLFTIYNLSPHPNIWMGLSIQEQYFALFFITSRSLQGVDLDKGASLLPAHMIHPEQTLTQSSTQPLSSGFQSYLFWGTTGEIQIYLPFLWDCPQLFSLSIDSSSLFTPLQETYISKAFFLSLCLFI